MKTETFEIEAGNNAQVTRRILYEGTETGAVRAAHRALRENLPGERTVIVRRPGCRELRRLERKV